MNKANWPQAKLHFHIALASILCPVIGVPLTWSLAIVNRFGTRAALPEQQRWTRRLLWLAVIDTLLAVLLFATVKPETTTAGGPAGPSGRVMGVSLDPSAPEPRIVSVVPGLPAERAGVKPGDLVRAVNGEKVETPAEARRAIAETREGQEVRLTLQRDGETLDVSVPLVKPGAARGRGLFQSETPICEPLRRTEIPWALLVVACATLGLYVAGRRKGMNATLVWVALVLFAISAVTHLVVSGTCHVVGGSSRGGFLLALATQTVLVLGAGLLLLRRVPSLPGPPQPNWFVLALRGGLYMLGGGIRVGVAILAVTRLLGLGEGATDPFESSPVHSLGASGLGLSGMLLFFIPVAIIGPIGEEVLFRGVVLPWLVAWMREKWALITSAALFAVLHLYYGPFVLVIFVYGLVFGWVRLRSGTLKPSIFLHISVNTTATLLLFLTSR